MKKIKILKLVLLLGRKRGQDLRLGRFLSYFLESYYFSWSKACFFLIFLNLTVFLGRKRVFFLSFLNSFFHKFSPLENLQN